MELTVLLGTFHTLEIVLYPSPYVSFLALSINGEESLKKIK